MPVTRRTNRRLPAYCTAGGKILLAELRTHEREALLEGMALRQLAPKTITSHEALRRALDKAKSEGVAAEEGECDDNVWALAVPVWNHLQEVVAAVVLHASGDGGQRAVPPNELVSSLRTAGRAISTWLGYRDVVGTRRGIT